MTATGQGRLIAARAATTATYRAGAHGRRVPTKATGRSTGATAAVAMSAVMVRAMPTAKKAMAATATTIWLRAAPTTKTSRAIAATSALAITTAATIAWSGAITTSRTIARRR